MSSFKRSSRSIESAIQQQKKPRQQLHDFLDGNDVNNRSIEEPESNEPLTCKRILAVPRKRKKSLSQCESNILEELLFPYTVNDFLNDSFRQHAVHVRWKEPEPCDDVPPKTTTKQQQRLRFPNVPMLQNLMNDPDIPSLVRETSSESVFVWLLKQQHQKQQQHAPDSKSNGRAKQTVVSQQSSTNQHPETGEEFMAPSHSLPPLIQSIEISDPDTAIKLHEMSGHALYFRAPPDIEQTLVGSLLHSTGFGCGQYDVTKLHTSLGRGEVEVFVGGHQHVSPNRMDQPHNPNPSKSNFVTGWHYDFQENFTVQISGMKRWTLHPGMVKHPLRGCTPHYDIVSTDSVMESQVVASRLANETLQSPTSMISTTDANTNAANTKVEIVDMYPGDVLYFPAGMWHTVETIESGISINISLMASNYATITCQALQHFLLRNEEWRQCIQNRNGSAVEQLQQLIQSLPNILKTAADNNEWNARMILPPVLYEPTKADSDEAADPDDDEDEDESDTDETDGVVKICDIVLPDIMIDGLDVFHQWPVNTHRLCRNPLATLLHEEKEIRNCFTNFQPLQSDRHYFPTPSDATGRNDCHSIYVLNVNFAGNESHESMIRYRLLLNDSTVQEIYGVVNRQRPLFSDADRLTAHHINCLVYYGFLSWGKIKE